MAFSARDDARDALDCITSYLGGGPSHHRVVCYQPLLVFNPGGDCADRLWRAMSTVRDEVLLPVIDRYRAQGQAVVLRADAVLALAAQYEALERRGVNYVIRLAANSVLERAVEDLLTRPRGRPATPR
jgi:hypothetical protein